MKNIQLQDSVNISVSASEEWAQHVNVTNRTDLLKDNYSEKVINDVVKAAVKNQSLNLAQIKTEEDHTMHRRVHIQNYTEEKIEHEGTFDDRDDPTKRNHTDEASEDEDTDK